MKRSILLYQHFTYLILNNRPGTHVSSLCSDSSHQGVHCCMLLTALDCQSTGFSLLPSFRTFVPELQSNLGLFVLSTSLQFSASRFYPRAKKRPPIRLSCYFYVFRSIEGEKKRWTEAFIIEIAVRTLLRTRKCVLPKGSACRPLRPVVTDGTEMEHGSRYQQRQRMQIATRNSHLLMRMRHLAAGFTKQFASIIVGNRHSLSDCYCLSPASRFYDSS